MTMNIMEIMKKTKKTERTIRNLIRDLKYAFSHNAAQGNINAPEIQNIPCIRDIIDKNICMRPVKADVVMGCKSNRNCKDCSFYKNYKNCKDCHEYGVMAYIANDRQFITDNLHVMHDDDKVCFHGDLKKLLDNADDKTKKVLDNMLQLYKSGLDDDIPYAPIFSFICHIYYTARYDHNNIFVTIKCDLTLEDLSSPSDPEDYYDDPSEIVINLFKESYAYISSPYHETTLIHEKIGITDQQTSQDWVIEQETAISE